MSASSGTHPHPVTSGRWFVDRAGRKLILRGCNLSGSSKSPSEPFSPSHHDDDGSFFRDLDVSFVGRPFPVADADKHLSQMATWGFNTLRWCITWEAVEHFGPGIYDSAFVDYLIDVIRIATRPPYSFKVFIDPHQDVWSRHTGGSGAPCWTLRLVGLNPETMYASGAAVCHSAWIRSNLGLVLPTMIWGTNYYKLAAATMFTCFFAGRSFAPLFNLEMPSSQECFNIQDVLQFHFITSMLHVCQRIHDAGLEYKLDAPNDLMHDGGVIGWDSLNEPNPGWIGCPDLNRYLPWQELRQGPTPTPIDCMLAGVGFEQSVLNYRITTFGPMANGTVLINPNGVSAWLARRPTLKQLFDEGMSAVGTRPHYINAISIDSILEEGYATVQPKTPDALPHPCLWASHGVFDPDTGELLKPEYFSTDPVTGLPINMATFTNAFWMSFVRRFGKQLRSIHRSSLLFLDPPVNEHPPVLNPEDAEFHHNLVYAPHWYDGLTLITKQFSWFNIDYLHVLRGHKNFLTGLRLGYNQVRKGIQAQLALVVQEGLSSVGNCPTLIGEIGIPFNEMSDETACEALDANMRAVERNLLSATLWNYCLDNTPEHGDGWNGEDLSLIDHTGNPRAAPALIRPFPMATSGTPQLFEFDYQASRLAYEFKSSLSVCTSCAQSMPWNQKLSDIRIPSNMPSRLPPHLLTVIFVPKLHFESLTIKVSAGDSWFFDPFQQRVFLFIGHPSLLCVDRVNINGRCQSCLQEHDPKAFKVVHRNHSVTISSN